MSTAKLVLFHQGSTELRRCKNCVFFLPVNILTGVTCRLLGPHDILPCVLIKVDIVPELVTNVNGYFTGTSPSFVGLSNKPVVSRRARVGMRPICPKHSTLGHAYSRFPRAFNFKGREK